MRIRTTGLRLSGSLSEILTAIDNKRLNEIEARGALLTQSRQWVYSQETIASAISSVDKSLTPAP